MKKIVLLWALLLAFVSAEAQEVDPQSNINAIKRDTSFIYAESTMMDAVEALSGARAILEMKLHEWLRNNYPDEKADVLVSESKEKWLSLLTKRGKYNRLLVYVSKRDVLPFVEEQTPIVAEEPVIEEVPVPELTPDEEAMAAISSFNDIEPYVKGMKSEGRIQAYGKYATLPQDAPCYMFVYDREGSVVAVLRQGDDGKHFNLRSQKEDNVRNYKNCGAIWLQLK